MSTARSGGVGARLVAPLLERLDADGIGAYLESSNPRNLSFYERLGFTELWTDTPAGGPPMTGMWRDPR
jgi:ribosomal protein S18 acetylase RimI-like enzyme